MFPEIEVDYDEGSLGSYRGVTVRIPGYPHEIRMASGHPATDMVAIWIFLGNIGWSTWTVNSFGDSVVAFIEEGWDLLSLMGQDPPKELKERGWLMVEHYFLTHPELSHDRR